LQRECFVACRVGYGNVEVRLLHRGVNECELYALRYPIGAVVFAALSKEAYGKACEAEFGCEEYLHVPNQNEEVKQQLAAP
jgi:hypothetical protein